MGGTADLIRPVVKALIGFDGGAVFLFLRDVFYGERKASYDKEGS